MPSLRFGLFRPAGALALLAACAGCTNDRQVAIAPRPAALSAQPPAQIIFFDPNAASITADGAAVLERTLKDFDRSVQPQLVVVGHADRVGAGRDNLQLSADRAEAVRRHLVEKGVPPEAVSTVAAGETQELVATSDGTPEAQNRRAEVYIVPGDLARRGLGVRTRNRLRTWGA